MRRGIQQFTAWIGTRCQQCGEWSVVLLVLTLLTNTAWSQQTARLVDGSSLDATLSRIEGESVVFNVDAVERTMKLDQLLRWGQPAELRRTTYLLLADGSLVAGEVKEISATEITLASTRRPGMWKSNRLPRNSVRAVVYQASASAGERDRFEARLLASSDAADRLLLISGDSLLGNLLEASPTDAGLLLRFLPQGAKEPLVVPQERVLAITLAAKVPPVTSPVRFHLGLADGSLLAAAAIEVSDDDVEIALAGGAKLVAQIVDNDVEPVETFWSRVMFLQPLSPQIVYLSDLKTIGFKHVPLLDWPLEFASDRSVNGARLRAAGQQYVKGIGMPATSRLAYEIPEGALRFEAEVAIDDEAGRAGSVVFRVFLEAAGGTWRPAAETKTFHGGDALQSLQVELGDARRLALVVEMADHGDQRDWANWLDARFEK